MQPFFLATGRGMAEPIWRPAIDVYRCDYGWLVKFDLAGVRVEDISLEASGCRLTLRGCRRDWATDEGLHHYLMEISYSHFERTVELPCELGSARLSTEYRDGMLLVRVQLEKHS